jgi:hypothetical protein
MNPSGNLFRIIGARTGKIIKGSAVHIAYVIDPCIPAIVPISGYVNRIEEPIAKPLSATLQIVAENRAAAAVTCFPRKY